MLFGESSSMVSRRQKGNFVLRIQTLCLTVLFALMACSTPSTPTGETPQTPFETSSDLSSISGKVAGWNRGVQKIVFQSTSSGNAPIVSEGSIDSSGQFSLSLPASIEESALNPFTNCPGTTVTPNSKTMFVPFVAVKSASGQFLGSIAFTNTDASLTGPFTPQAGIAFVTWLYSNQDSTARGSCTYAQGPTSTYDYQLKKGWNNVITEYTSATNLQLRSGQTSSKLTWRFSPTARKLTLDPQNIKLEIGQSKQYALSVQEADGTAVTGTKPIWSSTQPNIASVNGDGLVTATGLGQTEIRATLEGQTVSSTLTTFGLQVAGGTYSVSGQISSTPLNLSITGPAGWNNNQALTITYPANSNGYGFTSDVQAVTGTYTLTRNGSSTSFTVDATASIPVVQNLQITALYPTALTASFDQSGLPPNTSIKARVFDATTGQYVGDESPFFFSGFSFSFNATLDDLHQNELHVFSRSFDPNYSSNQLAYHVALLKTPLDFKPRIKNISHAGAPTSGNVKITISGDHFRNDSRVYFGDTLATSTSVDNMFDISVVVPARTAGVVDVTVRTALGTSPTSSSTKFQYFQMQKTDLGFLSRPELATAADGTLWFLPDYGNQIGKISTNGQISKYSFPTGFANTTTARALVIDQAGNAWFPLASFDNGTTNRTLVKVTPNGTFSSLNLPASIQTDVSSLVFGPDQKLWFTTTKINRIQTDGQGFTEFAMPGNEAPAGLVNGIDGALWFGASSNYINRVGKITTTGVINVFAQNSNADISALSAGPENKMWALQANQGWLKTASDGISSTVPWTTPNANSLFGFGSNNLTRMVFDGNALFWKTPINSEDTSSLLRIGTNGNVSRWAVLSASLSATGTSPFGGILSAPVINGGKVFVVQNGQLLTITP
jgi:streptogramin lyase